MQLAEHGSPLLVKSLGRVFGIGPAERAALGQNGARSVPVWIWVSVGLAAGFVAGARIQRRWPTKVPRLISG
jgi:hypothetical protein